MANRLADVGQPSTQPFKTLYNRFDCFLQVQGQSADRTSQTCFSAPPTAPTISTATTTSNCLDASCWVDPSLVYSALPSSCDLNVTCCDADQCTVAPCATVCDGFVECDKSTVCSDMHCEDLACRNAIATACFNKNCVDNACGQAGSDRAVYNLASPHLSAQSALHGSYQPRGFANQDPAGQYNGHVNTTPLSNCAGALVACQLDHDQPSSSAGNYRQPQICTTVPEGVLCSFAGCQEFANCYEDCDFEAMLSTEPRGDADSWNAHISFHQQHGPLGDIKMVGSQFAQPNPSSRTHNSSLSLASSPISPPTVGDQPFSLTHTTPPDFSPPAFPELHVCKWVSEETGSACGEVFPDSRSLQAHLVQTHAGQIQGSKGLGYYCCWEGCPRPHDPFSQKSKLQGHFLTHSGFKDFACRTCKKKFARAATLERHERSHRGEKPYKCHVCDKAFTDSSELKTHQRTHTGEKPFKCTYPGCNFETGDSSNMSSHKLTHYKRKHKCPLPGCAKIFTRPDQLKRHLLTKHDPPTDASSSTLSRPTSAMSR